MPVPLAPAVAAAAVLRTAQPGPRLRAEQLQRLAEDKSFRIDDAIRDLDYAPRPFADGIQAEAAALESRARRAGRQGGAQPTWAGRGPVSSIQRLARGRGSSA